MIWELFAVIGLVLALVGLMAWRDARKDRKRSKETMAEYSRLHPDAGWGNDEVSR